MSARRRGVLKGLRDKKFFAFGGCGCCTSSPSPTPAYYGGGRRSMIIVATFGQSQAGGKPNVFCLDADGNIVWRYNTGFSLELGRKQVEGIARDGDGNIYLAYSSFTTGAGHVIWFGIQKLDQDGNLLQDWTPSGWVIGTWTTPVSTSNFNVFGGDAGPASNTLWFDYPSGTLWWQHIGRQNGGTNKYDCISQLDPATFTELASYGASNFATSWNSVINTPFRPGEIQIDPGGNILNQFGQSTITKASLVKLSPTGTLLFDMQTATGFGQGGYTISGVGVSGRTGFGLHTAIEPPLGRMIIPVSADFTAAGTDQSQCDRISGIPVGWCTGLQNPCNQPQASKSVIQQNSLIAINNNTVNNTPGQTPSWQQNWCTPSWPGSGERLLSGSTFQSCEAACVAGDLFVQAFNHSRVIWAHLQQAHCVASTIFNSQVNFGLYSCNVSIGTNQALRSYNDIFNSTFASNSTGIMSLCYLKSGDVLCGWGQYQVDVSGGKQPHISVFGFNPGNLATKWRLDISTLGPLALDATTVTCIYADRLS